MCFASLCKTNITSFKTIHFFSCLFALFQLKLKFCLFVFQCVCVLWKLLVFLSLLRSFGCCVWKCVFFFHGNKSFYHFVWLLGLLVCLCVLFVCVFATRPLSFVSFM
uniref:(northern house mosquito) hypothetical protein n=1 Tax=Culex pipiens TaxID=7175 RepID=A0A8D8BEN5_CULPI